MLTFFCKRERHTDCPGEWPVGESCGPNHDCSFDMRMMKGTCECHAKKKGTLEEQPVVTHTATATPKSRRK